MAYLNLLSGGKLKISMLRENFLSKRFILQYFPRKCRVLRVFQKIFCVYTAFLQEILRFAWMRKTKDMNS